MAIRYSAEALLRLRESPLCTKPDNLPSIEDWINSLPDQLRAPSKSHLDRTYSNDSTLIDQNIRRPGPDRQTSRNNSNPEDLVFGPPRTSFSSARGNKALENEKLPRDSDTQTRPNLRPTGDRLRESRNANPRRAEAEQDADGWSTVKPRKSFGAEGVDRFHGKMGGNFRDEKRSARDRDDRDATRDRPSKSFDGSGRDKDKDRGRDKDPADSDSRSRNAASSRNKLEAWRTVDPKDSTTSTERRDRDRAKSWRDRDREADPLENRTTGKSSDRRWIRDRDQNQRLERDPEWLDEPQVDQREAHTQQDFQKWMEQMKAAKSGSSAANKPAVAPQDGQSMVEPPKPPGPSPAVEAGPDKFFMAFGPGANLDGVSPGEQKEMASKAKSSSKSSRFTSFFAQTQQDGRPRVDSSTIPSAYSANEATLASMPAPPPEEERQAFQQLLAKLQKQRVSSTPPGPSPFAAPQQLDAGKQASVSLSEAYPQFAADRPDGIQACPPPQQPQEILAPRPQQQSARPDQLLHEPAGYHHRVSSQEASQNNLNASRNNSNTEFLMNLMKLAPDAQQLAGQQVRLPPPQALAQAPPQAQKFNQPPPYSSDREGEFVMRENRGAPRPMRPQPPPGFPMDEPFQQTDLEQRPGQPAQILQRPPPPPPPGLDQMPPNWIPGGAQMPPPQQRGPMIPPPGLVGGPGRNLPIPPMFPPSFPPGGIIPPDALGGMPPRNMPIPPPGFLSGPPHAFVPPGLGGFNGPPGPEAHAFNGVPFEGRGMPPAAGGGGAGGPGAGGPGTRGANYGRP